MNVMNITMNDLTWINLNNMKNMYMSLNRAQKITLIVFGIIMIVAVIVQLIDYHVINIY